VDWNYRTILLADNPWISKVTELKGWLQHRIPQPYWPRIATEAGQRRWGEVNRAHLVIGPRQTGKSTLIRHHFAELGEAMLWIDCEQPMTRDWCSSPSLFLRDLKALLGRPVPLFFDEIQHLEEAGLFLKGLVDRKIGVPILVTGSSSYHLGAFTRESLAGRASRLRLFPFSLSEICREIAEQPELLREQGQAERFQRHLVFGGYPDVWFSDRPDLLLTDLVEATVLRDATDFFHISRPDAFRRLLRLMAGQCGNLINISEWASILGIHRDTVASYLEMLESSHITVALPPFAGGRRAEVTSRPKIYLVDNGIRNQLLNDFRPPEQRIDAGAMLENWAFTELWKALPQGATLHFWRSSSGAEVDFVLVRGDQILGIEVKATRLQRPRLPRAARSFIEAYKPQDFLLLNTGLRCSESLGETTVRWIQPVDLAASIQSAFREPTHI
jgi:predicted AAA+ superfamily ATPase